MAKQSSSSRTSSRPTNSSSSEYRGRSRSRGGTTRSRISSKARGSSPPSSSSRGQHDRSRSRPSSNSRRQHENDRSRPRSSASHGISKVRSCSSSGRFQHGSGTSRQHHVNGRSRQRSGKSSNYYSSQHSVSTRTTESSSQSGRFTRSVVRSIGNGSVSSIASKLLKRKKTNRTIVLYDKNELAKAWHRERAQSKRRELKARTPSPDTTEESSDCSRV